jgi:hypothetical protein
MTYATLASGSPIPNYLTQSPNTPFTVGKIQIIGEKIYGYSGMVDFDIAAAASYELISFNLERGAILKASFGLDWEVLDVTGNSVGFLINIDGTDVIRNSYKPFPNGEGLPFLDKEFFLPANRVCIISVLNLNAGADLLQANVSLIGKYI